MCTLSSGHSVSAVCTKHTKKRRGSNSDIAVSDAGGFINFFEFSTADLS